MKFYEIKDNEQLVNLDTVANVHISGNCIRLEQVGLTPQEIPYESEEIAKFMYEQLYMEGRKGYVHIQVIDEV